MGMFDSVKGFLEKAPDMAVFRADIGRLVQERKSLYDAALVAFADKKSKETGLSVELSEEEKWTEGTRVLVGLGMVELVHVNPDELTIEDARMWYKIINYKKGSVSLKQFQDYKRKAQASQNTSRDNFAQILANKAMLEFDQ